MCMLGIMESGVLCAIPAATDLSGLSQRRFSLTASELSFVSCKSCQCGGSLLSAAQHHKHWTIHQPIIPLYSIDLDLSVRKENRIMSGVYIPANGGGKKLIQFFLNI